MEGYEFNQRQSSRADKDSTIFAVAESVEAARSVIVGGYGISGVRLVGFGPEILKAARAAGCKDNDIIIK